MRRRGLFAGIAGFVGWLNTKSPQAMPRGNPPLAKAVCDRCALKIFVKGSVERDGLRLCGYCAYEEDFNLTSNRFVSWDRIGPVSFWYDKYAGAWSVRHPDWDSSRYVILREGESIQEFVGALLKGAPVCTNLVEWPLGA